MSLRDVPYPWGLVLSLGIAVLGCTGQTQTSNLPSASYVEPALATASEPEAAIARPSAADDRRADGLFAYTDPGELPQLRVSGEGDPLPLEHTSVDARVRGHVAEVRVKQRFSNDRKQPIEVVYTFPLPENAAVDDMRMVIGKRVIESEVQTRARARDTYESARADGHTAALLEQERPNIFTQSVANIAPGETIEVETHYLQTLTQDGGVQEFVFPMVVGPRFIPGEPIEVSGTGTYSDTHRVPDASRITPPIVGEGQRSGNDVSLTLEVDAGHSIDKWTAPTHTVVGAATKQGFALRLADAETIPNRDFVLRWQVASAQPSASLFLGPKDAKGRGHFALVIQPPQLELDELVGRREMIFVIDVSGSMSGIPLALAKQTLREALPRMRPVDTFDIVSFESGTRRLFGEAHPANVENLVIAERFIDGLQAGGGTQMASAVDAALSPPLYEGACRYVFFLTDGYIGNESEIFAGASALIERAQQAGGRARVFGLGIGSSPNQELISGLSRAGDGVPLYLSNREHPTAVVEEYYHWVDHPVLENLRVDWGGLKVESIHPSAAPDLFASHAVVFHGRYEGKVKGDVEVHARTPDKHTAVELAVSVSASKVDDRILATLWAREQIGELTTFTWDGSMDEFEVERAITDLGLEYHLVTAYTSLVAVDRSRVIGDGRPVDVVMPVEVPEDVDAVMAGAVPRDAGANDYKSMQSLEHKAKELAEVERVQEQERREHLLELEKRAEAAAPKLAISDVSVSAGLDQAAVEHALRGKQDALLRCIEGEAYGWTIRVRIELGADGRVLELARVGSTESNSDDIDTCIEQSLRAIDWSAWIEADDAVIEFDLAYA